MLGKSFHWPINEFPPIMEKNKKMNSTPAATATCRVMIVDDHPAIAQLLSDFLELQPGFQVAGMFNDAPSALAASATLAPDLVVLDIGLPEKSAGLDLLRDISARLPRARLLVFSALANMQVVRQALQLGAHGFLEKSAPFPELLAALQQVSQGKTYLGAQASAMLRQAVISDTGSDSPRARELTVLRLLARGMVVKEIAETMELSPSMVYKQLELLRTKFNARTNEDLVLIAVDRGWIEIEAKPKVPAGA